MNQPISDRNDVVLRAIPTVYRRRCDLDDGCLVFHRLTFETHYFNLMTTYILTQLEEKPASRNQLCTVFAEELNVPNDDELLGKIGAVVTTLDAMAMVEPCPD